MNRFVIHALLCLALLPAAIVAAKPTVPPGENKDPRAVEQRFLAENAKKKGAISLPSGVQYKGIKKGRGRRPTLEDTVTVHYLGTFLDGTAYENTYRAEMPETLRMDVAVPGDGTQIFRGLVVIAACRCLCAVRLPHRTRSDTLQ